MSYAILRTEKIKNTARAAVIHAHNTRSSNPINADPNGSVKVLIPCDDLPAAINARIESTGVKRRSNSVIAQEILLAASPEYFRPNDPARAGHWEKGPTKDWAVATRNWLRSEYGDRLISAHLHLDESTPHIHAVVIPITKDNRLSARELFNPLTLAQTQTSYAKAVAHLGLSRGIEGSVATHEAVRDYYIRVNGPAPELPTIPTPPVMVTGNARATWAADQTQAVAEAVEPMAAQAREMKAAQAHAAEAQATAAQVRDQAAEWKRETARVRDLPLADVLHMAGLKLDPDDKKQWKGEGMRISLDGSKWYDHTAGKGGGGAIDLAIHCTGAKFKDAVAWLGGHFEPAAVESAAAHRAAEQARGDAREAMATGSKAGPPEPLPETWARVRRYLVETRALRPELVDSLHQAGKIYSDKHGNAVFAYGSAEKPEQVELRGTGIKPFHGFRGSKNSVFDIVPPEPRAVAVVESAIDAISYAQLHPRHVVAAVGGGCGDELLKSVAAMAKELDLPLIAAFDADEAGEGHTKRLKAQAHAVGVEVQRARPTKGKDWNDELKASSAAQEAPVAPGDREALSYARDAREARSADDLGPSGPSLGR